HQRANIRQAQFAGSHSLPWQNFVAGNTILGLPPPPPPPPPLPLALPFGPLLEMLLMWFHPCIHCLVGALVLGLNSFSVTQYLVAAASFMPSPEAKFSPQRLIECSMAQSPTLLSAYSWAYWAKVVFHLRGLLPTSLRALLCSSTKPLIFSLEMFAETRVKTNATQQMAKRSFVLNVIFVS
ncbi:unnamed protein product, partial [Prunus brigantina]